MGLEQIEEYVRKREFTDYIMPLWLPFLPVILSLTAVIIFITFFFYTYTAKQTYFESYHLEPIFVKPFEVFFVELLIALLLIVSAIINIYVLYKWIWRRNEHFKRVRLLFSAIKDFLKERGYNVSRLEMVCVEIEVEETEKNAILWTLLPFVPYVGWILLIYIYHFLNKDFYRHERREDNFLNALSSLLPDFSYVRYSQIPERNTILYFVLTFLTLGFFSFYWIYTLTKDPNNHFVEHRRWEDQLLNVLRKI
ncbi:DUF4234 domain-containing protein [Archaeoglobus sp.]